jgi:hypothetical protein
LRRFHFRAAGARRRLRLLVRVFPVDHKDFSDMLHRLRIERFTDFGKQRFALAAFRGVSANLDQFVAGQRPVGFLQHRGGEAGGTDQNDRIERMGRGAQAAPGG